MPRIREYIAKPTLLHPSDAGFSAFETAGRRIGPLYHEAAAALEEQGKLKAQGLAEQITPFKSAERIEQARQDLLRAQAREAQLVAEGQVKLGSAGLPHIHGSPVIGNGGFVPPSGRSSEDGNYGGGGDTVTPAGAAPGLNGGLSASLDQVSQGAAGLATMLNTAAGGSHMVTVNDFSGPRGIDMAPVPDVNSPGVASATGQEGRVIPSDAPQSYGEWLPRGDAGPPQSPGEWVRQFITNFNGDSGASTDTFQGPN